MAPRPENEPDGYRVLSTLMSMISSFLGYSKPSLRKEPKEIVNIMDQPVPPIPDTPPLIPSKVPIPTPWELPTAGPEKEPWLGIPELKGTDDYAELTKNPWSYKQKRSSMIYLSPPPSMAGTPIMLTLKKQSKMGSPFNM